MGLSQRVFNCGLCHLVMLFLLALTALYHFIFLPDVDALMKFVSPKHQSEFSPDLPKSQSKRQLRVKEVCANHSPQSKRISDSLLIDESSKVAFCSIPKVGSTNWRKALILATGRISESDLDKVLETRNKMEGSFTFQHERPLYWKFGIYHSDEYTQSSLKQLFPSFFKFMLVRCPYQRLLSAYRNKFRKSYYQKTYGVQIVKRYRPNATLSSLETGSDVTFHEFLQFIADSVDKGESLDRHWMPFHKICDPCVHNFDFIGKMETLEEDCPYILNRLGGDAKFPSAESGPSSLLFTKNTSSCLLEYYSKIPPLLLQRITRIYLTDFELFGYNTDLKNCSPGD